MTIHKQKECIMLNLYGLYYTNNSTESKTASSAEAVIIKIKKHKGKYKAKKIEAEGKRSVTRYQK